MTTHNGKIKCFLGNKNFGFITETSTGNDIFFHPRNLCGALKGMLNNRELVGTPVTYTLGKNSKGAAAMNIAFDVAVAMSIDASKAKLDNVWHENLSVTEAQVETTKIAAKTSVLKEKLSSVGSTVGDRMLSIARIDDPKAVEVAKIRVTNFGLMAAYNSKVGLSRMLIRVVYGLDRAGDFLSRAVNTLAETKKPILKQLENK